MPFRDCRNHRWWSVVFCIFLFRPLVPEKCWPQQACGPRRQRLCDRRYVGSRGCRFRLGLNCRLCGYVEFTGFICFSCSIASLLCSRITLPGLVCLFRSFTALLCNNVGLLCGSGLSSSGPMFRLRGGF